jgi:hypothetical protein
MYLSFEFQFGFHIAFRLMQADQSIELVNSLLQVFVTPATNYVPLFVEQSLNRNDSRHGPTWMLRFPFFSGV